VEVEHLGRAGIAAGERPLVVELQLAQELVDSSSLMRSAASRQAMPSSAMRISNSSRAASCVSRTTRARM